MRMPKRHGATAFASLVFAWLAIAAILPAPISASAATAGFTALDTAHCVSPATLDLARILPPPPAEGSPEERADLDALLRIQATRTPAQAEQAREDAKISLFRFAGALGNPSGFTPEKLPLTLEFFREIGVDESAVIGASKREFARPRPFTVEPRLNPVIPRPTSSSYPSGHSTWAYATALVLADMVPERRAQILARAEEFAHNRSVAGVHYLSDVEGGRLAGTALAAMLFDCKPFEKEEAAARVELRNALHLK